MKLGLFITNKKERARFISRQRRHHTLVCNHTSTVSAQAISQLKIDWPVAKNSARERIDRPEARTTLWFAVRNTNLTGQGLTEKHTQARIE